MSSRGPAHLAVWLTSRASWPSFVMLHSPVPYALVTVVWEGGSARMRSRGTVMPVSLQFGQNLFLKWLAFGGGMNPSVQLDDDPASMPPQHCNAESVSAVSKVLTTSTASKAVSRLDESSSSSAIAAHRETCEKVSSFGVIYISRSGLPGPDLSVIHTMII